MPPPPASVGVVPSDRPHAVVPAATSLASRPPRTVTRAQRPDTSKRPRNRGRLAVESPNKTALAPPGPQICGAVGAWEGPGPQRRSGGADRDSILREPLLDLGHGVQAVVED